MRSFKNTMSVLGLVLVLLIFTPTVCAFVVCCSHSLPKQAPTVMTCDQGEINPAGVHLDISMFKQDCDKWCWATDVAMIATYYKKSPVRPCDLVNHIFTVTTTQASSTATITMRVDCCAPYACNTGCNDGGNDDQIKRAFRFTGYDYRPIGGVATDAHLQLELSSERPVMIVILNTVTNQQHVRILTGFRPPKTLTDSTRYRVLDSLLKAPVDLDYEDLADVPGSPHAHRWKDTWVLTATMATECRRVYGKW